MMKRFCLLLGLFLLAACGGDEADLPTAVPAAVLSQNNTDATQPEALQLAPLPPLAGGSVVSGLPAAAGGPDTAAGIILPADPFANTLFTLNTQLPDAPEEMAVWRQTQSDQIDTDAARRLAARFGFEGELYQEIFPDFGVSQSGAAPFRPPTVYYTFAGPRTFSIDSWSATYQDTDVSYAAAGQADFAAASQAAERFLQERGLLDFPYIVQQGPGNDVFFVRQLDGRTLNHPEIVAGAGAGGQLSFINYQVMPNLENLGLYPLIPAAAAWAQLESGVDRQFIPYVLHPAIFGSADTLAQVHAWQRPYPPGEMVQLYGWPNVYLPVSGSGPARVQLFPYMLQGDAEVINQIAEVVGQLVRVEGVMGDDGKTVTVHAGGPIEGLTPLSLPGIIRRDGERTMLDAEDGQTYQLPHAPADLPDNLAVFVFAWDAQQIGDATSLLQWDRIDTATIITEESLAEPLATPGYANVSINGVEPAYFMTYLYPEEGVDMGTAVPTIVLQPAWKFVGTTSTGEKVEFFVQAVADEFVQ